MDGNLLYNMDGRLSGNGNQKCNAYNEGIHEEPYTKKGRMLYHMARKKLTRYNIDKLAAENSTINILFGERSNGKSYQIKHKIIMPAWFERHERFMYVRRWKDEINQFTIEQYFADVDIEKLTDGKYNTVQLWRKKIYLAKYDPETMKTSRGEFIGYAVVLSQEQNLAGGSFLDVTNIIYEEFMSRSMYVSGEPAKLSNLFSTIDRKRGTTKMWLVGNTITRSNPYLVEWDILKDVMHLKQGNIFTKKIEVADDIYISLSVEHCFSTGDTSYVIGKNASMINTGEWQSEPQPHLPDSIKNYRCLFRCLFIYKTFQFIGELLQKGGNKIWFIYPRENGNIRPGILVFSDVVRPDPYWQTDIYHCKVKNKRILEYCDLFTEDRIFYSDDLTGTDFKNVINFSIRK